MNLLIRERLSTISIPVPRARDPSLLQRNDMVNIDVRRSGPRRTVVVAVPGTGSRLACVVCGDTRAVASQNVFSGVAVAFDGDPGLEVVSFVRWAVRLGLNGDLAQIGPSSRSRHGSRQVASTDMLVDGCCESAARSSKNDEDSLDSHFGSIQELLASERAKS